MKSSLIYSSLFALVFFTANSQKVTDYRSLLKTSDELFWNDKDYYIDNSPLADFEGYESLFPDLEKRIRDTFKLLHIFPIYGGRAAPFFEDKNYSVFWKIVDNKLYLNEIYLYKLLSPIDEDKILFPDNEQYKAIEHLTGKEFNKDDSAVIEKTVAPYGVIQATWVNGDFIIKPVIPDSVGWTSEWEKTEPAFRISFKNGE